MSTEPSWFLRRSMRDERSAIFCSFRINARVSTSYTVTDQNSLTGGWGGTRSRYDVPPSSHSSALSLYAPRYADDGPGRLGAIAAPAPTASQNQEARSSSRFQNAPGSSASSG